MTRTGISKMAVGFSFAALLGCSGGAGTSGAMSGSGVDGTKLVSALTMDERGKICDYFASLVGGYGKSNDCGQGSFWPPMSQSDCIQQFSICDAKESDYEACSKANQQAEKTCTDTAFGMAVGTDACKAVTAAGC
jgi:hypothetical protein